MIPYFELKVLVDFGSLQVYTFGTLVGLAIVMGLYLITHRARQLKLDPEIAEHMHYWTVGVALVTGHLFTILVYEPGRLEREGPLLLLKLWDGMSSMGGIMGGLAAAYILLRIVKKVPLTPYLDAYFYAFTFSWAMARLGCTLVHDHPGALSDFFLAIQYPCTDDPSQVCARHDLGFYEFLGFTALSIYFYLTRFKPRFPGFYVLSWGLVMGPLRFAADFLRIDPTAQLGGDLRYGSLTPAQYAIIPLFLISIYAVLKLRKSGELITPIAVPFSAPTKEAPKSDKKARKAAKKGKKGKRK